MSKIIFPHKPLVVSSPGMGPQYYGVLEATPFLVQLASLTQVLGESGSVHVLGCLIAGTGQN